MANLPADLPENWTQGQIISPNGTEVGLTEQHGYNYLMQQVNAAQTAINNIVAGISGVAQETSVQEIIANIGNTDDRGATDNSGTVMGKLNANIVSIDTIKEILLLNIKSQYPDEEYTIAGSHQTAIPPFVTGVKVTACGGGGGGGAGGDKGDKQQSYSGAGGGGGGGGGAAVQNKLYELDKSLWGKSISITVGKGGAAGQSGGSTIIPNIATLAGGSAGKKGAGIIYGGSVGGAGGAGGNAGGAGGGKGGQGGSGGVPNSLGTYSNGETGKTGASGIGSGTTGTAGGTSYDNMYGCSGGGGGGGGSLNSSYGVGGKGGHGYGFYNDEETAATAGTAGKNGYVKLSWVWE